MVYEITIKQSLKRYGMWQIKGERHEIYPLDGMKLILMKMLKHLDRDPEDNRSVYLMKFSPQSFDSYFLELKKVNTVMDSHGTGCEYSVVRTNEMEYFMSDPTFPSVLKKIMGNWPEKLFVGLELTGKSILAP